MSLYSCETNVKVAFIRDGYVWIKVDGHEEKITDKKAMYNYPPQWSFDGKILLYQKEAPALFNENQSRLGVIASRFFRARSKSSSENL